MYGQGSDRVKNMLNICLVSTGINSVQNVLLVQEGLHSEKTEHIILLFFFFLPFIFNNHNAVLSLFIWEQMRHSNVESISVIAYIHCGYLLQLHITIVIHTIMYTHWKQTFTQKKKISQCTRGVCRYKKTKEKLFTKTGWKCHLLYCNKNLWTFPPGEFLL